MKQRSLKRRLVTAFAVAILIPAVAAGLAGVFMIRQHVYRQAQSKVNSDLESAAEIYQNYLQRLQDSIRIHATRMIVYDAASTGDTTRLGPELRRVQTAERLDVLTLTDLNGEVLFRTNNPSLRGSQASDKVIQRVLAKKTPIAATDIIGMAELSAESEELGRRAYIAVTPTPYATPTGKTVANQGMVLKAAAPVFTPDNRMVGVLWGAVLLNRDTEIVDKIRKTVFKQEAYKGSEIGTATIFQDDVRVSTNVMDSAGRRAIGTRVSAQVAELVLRRGQRWQDRAFVVTDWYISAYAPIRNFEGTIIGMLYVGILERPYSDSLWRSVFVFLGIIVLAVILVGIINLTISYRISRPVRLIAEAMQRLAKGEHPPKIEVRSNDEIGHLAENFNKMSDELAAAHRLLIQSAETLERKVEERTAELKEMQENLIQTEKLAALGKLAAGVAHEINNPLTGILTNSSLMLEDCTEDDPLRPDLQVIVDETLRCRKIVKGLLDFARQTPPRKQLITVNQVVDDILSLLRNQVGFREINVETRFDPTPCSVMADQDQIRQVILNIVLNAAEAMAGEGEMTISSSIEQQNRVIRIAIHDNGPGIPDEVKSRIFEPFFTTKSNGTGLGLSIAYGIVERHGGAISIASTKGQGTTVSVDLPLHSVLSHA
ncbi:MAG: HAMP domain-containing protein [Acidobacteria bacterium]|nr:MAG: HAMP domain-containing protein [Acidobacteriota bacterium]